MESKQGITIQRSRVLHQDKSSTIQAHSSLLDQVSQELRFLQISRISRKQEWSTQVGYGVFMSQVLQMEPIPSRDSRLILDSLDKARSDLLSEEIHWLLSVLDREKRRMSDQNSTERVLFLEKLLFLRKAQDEPSSAQQVLSEVDFSGSSGQVQNFLSERSLSASSVEQCVERLRFLLIYIVMAD